MNFFNIKHLLGKTPLFFPASLREANHRVGEKKIKFPIAEGKTFLKEKGQGKERRAKNDVGFFFFFLYYSWVAKERLEASLIRCLINKKGKINPEAKGPVVANFIDLSARGHFSPSLREGPEEAFTLRQKSLWQPKVAKERSFILPEYFDYNLWKNINLPVGCNSKDEKKKRKLFFAFSAFGQRQRAGGLSKSTQHKKNSPIGKTQYPLQKKLFVAPLARGCQRQCNSTFSKRKLVNLTLATLLSKKNMTLPLPLPSSLWPKAGWVPVRERKPADLWPASGQRKAVFLPQRQAAFHRLGGCKGKEGPSIPFVGGGWSKVAIGRQKRYVSRVIEGRKDINRSVGEKSITLGYEKYIIKNYLSNRVCFFPEGSKPKAAFHRLGGCKGRKPDPFPFADLWPASGQRKAVFLPQRQRKEKKRKVKICTSLSDNQLKGYFASFIIKGYGKRARRSKSLFVFRIGLRKKKGILPKNIIPRSLFLKSKKKHTFFKVFTTNKKRQKAFFHNIIKLQGSSKKLPAFSYKDIGIRIYGIKVKKKQRRVS
jgi:hypothetical protein